MVDLSADLEKYDGFWNQDGKHIPDPPGSDLKQYRLNLGAAYRLGKDWQASLSVPYVWNVNTYASVSSRSDGIGDTTLSVWYEALEERSVWKFKEPADYIPSVTIGPSLLIPTGISPYDDEESSFDVTGRGFYRLDGNVQIDKGFHPFTTSVSLAYGKYFSRPVDREYGRYVAPYRKTLGDRVSASASIGYILVLGSAGDKLTGTASLSYLHEADGTIDGARNPNSGFAKTSAGGQLMYSSTDHDWSLRAAWNHAIRSDGWGENFPTTDIYTLGVRYGFR